MPDVGALRADQLQNDFAHPVRVAQLGDQPVAAAAALAVAVARAAAETLAAAAAAVQEGVYVEGGLVA